MRGFVVVFKGAYEIASLSSRKIRRWADRLRLLRAFVRASARQKPGDRYYFFGVDGCYSANRGLTCGTDRCCLRSDLWCRPLCNESYLNEEITNQRLRLCVSAFDTAHPEKTGRVFLLRIRLE